MISESGEGQGIILEQKMHDCGINGTLELSSSGAYVCICPEAYIGEKCQIQANICSEVLCHKNGKCMYSSVKGIFYCVCYPNWAGKKVLSSTTLIFWI